jgi:23S rRNA pseudoU1915 N3-methylase RlmH
MIVWRAADTAVLYRDAGASEVCRPDLASGALTRPHQLVRIMLLEQINRATTILSGSPI